MTTTANESNQTNMLKKLILQIQSLSPLLEKKKVEKSSSLWFAGIMVIAFVMVGAVVNVSVIMMMMPPVIPMVSSVVWVGVLLMRIAVVLMMAFSVVRKRPVSV